jgi:RNA polymerase sigma-70 factor (sigma-E family)
VVGVDRDREFGDYYTSRADRMRGAAYLMCGDWHRAEDVVQTAFVRLYLGWHRVNAEGAIDQYVRQIITRSLVDESRRPWRRERVVPSDELPEATVNDPPPEERMVLVHALAQVPARQRVTLVLRFFEDLSVEETAAMLRVSVGTVKSQTSRGLDALRAALSAANVSLPSINGGSPR